MKGDIEKLGIAEAKATFARLVSQVEKKRQSVCITRNGREVARLVPTEVADPLAKYKFGGGRIVGDIESPASDPGDWEYD